ncbi:MAG: hypothetical protein K6T34_11030 [Thermoflavifilum sp.]|nr:hypothetical protein [Thermoflavifilum sp.]
MPPLRLLHQRDIDPQQWDGCIAQAPNKLPYAYYHYLCAMTDEWLALVAGDYQAVMPLPIRKKYGIRYVYRPPFIQQLGIFRRNLFPDETCIYLFYQALARHVAYINYSVEAHSIAYTPKFRITWKPNYVLHLSESYAAICSRYHSNLKRSLKKASAVGLIIKSADLNEAISFFYNHYRERIPGLNMVDCQRLVVAARINMPYRLFAQWAMSKDGEPLAMVVWLTDEQRMIALLNGTSSLGRALGAMHFLLDRVISQHAASSRIFDFEGSALPGVARFIQNFGAISSPYATIRYFRFGIWGNHPKRYVHPDRADG